LGESIVNRGGNNNIQQQQIQSQHLLTSSQNQQQTNLNNTNGSQINQMKQSGGVNGVKPNNSAFVGGNAFTNNGNTLRQNFNDINTSSTISPIVINNSGNNTLSTLNQQQQNIQVPRSITPIKSCKQSKNIRLSSQAVVATTYGPEDETCGLIKRILVQKLPE
jgi:hypothetical protein